MGDKHKDIERPRRGCAHDLGNPVSVAIVAPRHCSLGDGGDNRASAALARCAEMGCGRTAPTFTHTHTRARAHDLRRLSVALAGGAGMDLGAI